jgi:hypothetical protein
MWSRLDGANRSTPYGHVADAQAHPGQQAATHARLHDLRHLHATTLLLSGVPVHVVAARLGHADPAIYPPRLRTRDPLSRGRRRDIFAEPMTYALRGACSTAPVARPAQIARLIASEALIAMKLRCLPFHDPFHGRAVDGHCVATGLDGPLGLDRGRLPGPADQASPGPLVLVRS